LHLLFHGIHNITKTLAVKNSPSKYNTVYETHNELPMGDLKKLSGLVPDGSEFTHKLELKTNVSSST